MTAAGHAEKLALLLVDDHELILLGIRQSLEREGTAGDLVAVRSAAEALQALRSRRFDLCVVDLELPDLPGFELIDAIRRQDPAARIVVNTMHNEIWTVNRLLQSGVGVKIIEIDAKRAVQKAFRLNIRIKVYIANIVENCFSGQNRNVRPHCLCRLSAHDIVNIKLRACNRAYAFESCAKFNQRRLRRDYAIRF